VKDLPLGIGDYKRIIKGNFIYVDKTRYLYELAKKEGLYFLSRPRRFGKSLMLSTLYYLFKGEKELFEGTWIYDKWEWQEYPVIRIDLTDIKTETVEKVEFGLKLILKNTSEEYDVEIPSLEIDASYGLSELINRLYRKYNKQVIVLIDEYEKPVLDNITDKEKAEKMRKELRSFYSVLKAQMDKIRFLLITGLTKFTKMGVFSALNNLEDISFDEKYAQMLGYTHEEVVQYFGEYIQRYLELTGLSKEEFLEMFREYYDGYSFDGIWYDEGGKDRRVYNPFAVLLFFSKMRFAPYWSDSGAPSFVYEYLKGHNVSKNELLKQKVSESDFSQWEIEDNPPHLFLAQAGYLTQRLLTTRTSLQPIYELSIPNTDARLGIEKLLFSTEQKIDLATVTSKVNALAYAIEARDIQEMVEVINSIYARVSWRARKQIERSGKEDRLTHLEVFYQSIMVSLFESTGVNVESEEESAKGRADVVVKYNGVVYVIELKVDRSAQEALEQIKAKGYHEPYKGKEVYLIGMNISSKTGKIEEFVYEKI